VSTHNIQFFIPVLPSHLAIGITLSTLLSASPQYKFFHPSVTFPFGPRYHSQHLIMGLPTIYSSSPLCYLPLLAPDITLSTLLCVTPQYTFLHPSDTFQFWPQISLSSPYYETPHNIQFFTPLLSSAFGPRYHSQHPIMSLPTIYSSSFLSYLPLLDPHIIPSTLLSVSPQYTVLHPSVTFPFWPKISLSAPYYESPHNINFFIPELHSHFGPRYHSQHPIMCLPTIYSSSPLCYLPLLAPVITLSTLL